MDGIINVIAPCVAIMIGVPFLACFMSQLTATPATWNHFELLVRTCEWCVIVLLSRHFT